MTEAEKVGWAMTPDPRPEWFAYKPQPDITLYELAMIMPVFSLASQVNGKMVWSYLTSLPPECMRHFEKV